MHPEDIPLKLPFHGHLEELRKRLMWCFASVLVLFAVAYAFSERIMNALFYPVRQALPPGSTLVYTSLTEGFMTHLKVAFWTALVLAAPFILHQAWAFVSPGLYTQEKRTARRFLLSFSGLFLTGGVFGYWVIMPVVLSISLGYASADLEPLPRLQNYLLFALKTIFTFGLIFELPFAMCFATRSGIVHREYFRRNRKFSYIALYILAVLVSPADLFAQILLFLPLMGMYEVGILLGGSRPPSSTGAVEGRNPS